MEDEFVCVSNMDKPDSAMEFPLENDGTLTLSTVQSHFPNAIGLKYKAASGAWRGIRAVDNVFEPPKAGWGNETYYITEGESTLKRKMDDDSHTGGSKKLPKVGNLLLQDIGVFSLPYSTTDSELKEYFQNHCGDVEFAEVKIDRSTGKSRGFGFIRFATEDAARAAIDEQHIIGGRSLELKLKQETPMKIFVGRLSAGTTKDHLFDYFSTFGEVTDTYVPSPHKGFGFVTFASSDVGKSVLNDDHVLNGVKLNLNKGEESKTYRSKVDVIRTSSRDRHYRDPYRRDGDSGRRGRDNHSRDRESDFKSQLYAYLQRL